MHPISLNLFDAAFLAQTQTTITPESFGPLRWWDAGSYTHLGDGSFINPGETDEWKDLSPNHSHARSTAGKEPRFFTNVINGRPVVRFVGAKRMLFNSGDVTLNDFTVLAVVLTANDSIFLSREGGNQQIRTERENVHKSSFFATSGSEVVSNLFTSDNTEARMAGYRKTLYPDGIASEFIFFDNSNIVTPENGVVQNKTAIIINQIGLHDAAINIDIAELVIYDRSLTTSQIQILYNRYFKPKFALP